MKVPINRLFAPDTPVIGESRLGDMSMGFVLKLDGTIGFALKPIPGGKTYIFPVWNDGGISVIGDTGDMDEEMPVIDGTLVSDIIRGDFFWVHEDGRRVEGGNGSDKIIPLKFPRTPRPDINPTTLHHPGTKTVQ